ncbi:MAG: NADP oxidoreductase [Anaerolineaceae bacterium 4572_78]|nr:MAG: NADP oxidoreductase [Anaerolineaceae bacterium 4572_78]
MSEQANGKIRIATAWLGGCAGCHMSFLDIDEAIIDLANVIELVYSPIADVKEFPEDVVVTLVEGAITNIDTLKLAKTIRERSKIVVSFGDCAVTGNVPSLRNYMDVDKLLHEVYRGNEFEIPPGNKDDETVPNLLEKVVPLHHAIHVDVHLPGCPPDPKRILAAVTALLNGQPVALDVDMRTFG